MVVIGVGLEGVSSLFIVFQGGVDRGRPDAVNIVNKPDVKDDGVFSTWQKFKLVEALEDVSPHWCWWFAHRRARPLFEVEVAEPHDIFVHHDG